MNFGYGELNGVRAEFQIMGSGPRNTRIRYLGGDEEGELVPTGNVERYELGQGCRVVPQTPLKRFYKEARSFRGEKNLLFDKLKFALQEENTSIESSDFLSELFIRSAKQADSYDNHFYPFYQNSNRGNGGDGWADTLVRNWTKCKLGETSELIYIDREITPFGTHQSVKEDGTAASDTGSGGIDILLAEGTGENVVPVVGEIKADTESVGPTFALIQALTYAAELVTKNQFRRLATFPKWHPDTPESYKRFNQLDEEKPRGKLLIVLESEPTEDDRTDFEFAKELACNTLSCLREKQCNRIAEIVFAEGAIDDNNAVSLKQI